jgi:hypothetical protein
MIAEVVDTAIALGWALLAWIAVFAAAGTLLLLGTAAGIAWAWRALRKRHSGRLAASEPASVPRDPDTAERPSGARTPPCAHSQPLDYEETA